MIRQHAEAILGALTDAGLSAFFVADVPPSVATPYVVLTPSPGHPDRDTLAGRRTRLDSTFQVAGVGASVPEALEAAGRARDALLDVRLSIPGRRPWPIVHGDSQPVREDPVHIPDGSSRALLVAVDTYGLSTVPS